MTQLTPPLSPMTPNLDIYDSEVLVICAILRNRKNTSADHL